MKAGSALTALCLSLAPLGPGCASNQRLTRADVVELAGRTWDAPPNEVFDATWLTLEAQGYRVGDVDRVAGTLSAKKQGRQWTIDVSARGSEQRVLLTPREDEVTREDLVSLLDPLEEGTRSLLRAWRELPEWKFDGRRNSLSIPGFSASPPRDWEWIDFDISRRHGVVQARRARLGVNPTLLFDAERRMPEPTLGALVKKATGLTLGARQRLVFPESLDAREDASGQHGAMRVLDGSVPVDVAWHALVSRVGPVDVQLVMVCPKNEAASCAVSWAELAASVVK